MFAHASAIVAVLSREPGWEDVFDCLERATSLIISSVAIWEVVRALARRRASVAHANQEISAFIEATGVVVVELGNREAALAVEAHAKFGKGEHKAKLNMGDCFAYACAKAHSVPLLDIGDDFAQTDIEPALRRA